MKKNYFMLAAATMMFAACAETDLVNEITVEETQQAIGFETFAQKATRATTAPTAPTAENSGSSYTANDLSNHHSDFLVWASKKVKDNTATTETYKYVSVYSKTNKGTVSSVQTVADDATTTNIDESKYEWFANPLKYWDKTATEYEFYAAAPATQSWIISDETVTNASTIKLENFALTGGADDNLAPKEGESWKALESASDIDLMIAAPCLISNPEAAPSVNLDFIHILSRLNIAVKASSTATTTKTQDDKVVTTTYSPTIKLTALNVYGLMNMGTFDESTSLKIGTNEDGSDKNQNLAEGTNLRWGTPTSNGTTYILAAHLGADDATELTLTGTATFTHKYLIIPQLVENKSASTNVASAPSNEAYLQIKYTVDGEAYETYYSLAQAFGIALDETNNDSEYLAFNEGWQNTLTITISPDEIKFTGDVATWADNTKKDDQTID